MTTTNEKETTKAKQVPDFYIFEDGVKNGKPAGVVFIHKKGKGFNLLIQGKKYAAFPPKPKTAETVETTKQPEGESA